METIIINKRHELPRRKRLFWDAMTLLLWAGWFYLWKPFLIIFYQIITLEVEPDEVAAVIFDTISAIPFEKAIFMLTATPIVLFVLSRLNRHQAPTEHLLYNSSDYAAYFDLDHTTIDHCTQQQLITVYHDAQGHITSLEDTITLKKG